MSTKFFNGLDLQNQRIINLSDPSSATDAVTMQWAQALVRGLSWKASARAASTANVSLTAPGTTLDGVTLIAGDRILLKNQTNAPDNGVYTWTGGSSTLTRTSDMSTGAQLMGATLTITEGTVNQNEVWTQTADGTSEVITVGTTNLAWAQVGGSSPVYTAGNGLILSASQFAVVPGAGIIADGTSTRIDPSVTARHQSYNIGDGSSTVITVTHTMGTQDLVYTLTDTTSSRVVVNADVAFPTTTTCTITFAVAPASNAFRITLAG